MNNFVIALNQLPETKIINIGLNYYKIEYKPLFSNSEGDYYYIFITCNGKTVYSGDVVGVVDNPLLDMLEVFLEKFCDMKIYNLILI